MRERLSRDTEKLCEFSSMLSRRIKDIVTTKHDEAVCERVKPSSVTQSRCSTFFLLFFFFSEKEGEKEILGDKNVISSRKEWKREKEGSDHIEKE